MGTGMANGNGNGNGETPPAPDPYEDEVKSLNPIAYWRLSDPLGSTEANGRDRRAHSRATIGRSSGHRQLRPGTGPESQRPERHVGAVRRDRLRRGRPRRDFETLQFTVEALVHPDSVVGRARRRRQHVLLPHCRRRVGAGHRPAFRHRRPGHRWVLRARDKRWLRPGQRSSPGARLTSQSSAPPGTWRSRSTAWSSRSTGME